MPAIFAPTSEAMPLRQSDNISVFVYEEGTAGWADSESDRRRRCRPRVGARSGATRLLEAGQGMRRRVAFAEAIPGPGGKG